MTGCELQSRIIGRVEAHYLEVVTAARKAGTDPARAHEMALEDALRLLAESLEELRRRGLFPFPEGEVPLGGGGLGHA